MYQQSTAGGDGNLLYGAECNLYFWVSAAGSFIAEFLAQGDDYRKYILSDHQFCILFCLSVSGRTISVYRYFQCRDCDGGGRRIRF